MAVGTRLVDRGAIATMLGGIVPSSTTLPYYSLKNYHHVAIVISVANTTGVTGSAIALQQATDVSGTSAKALAFTTAFRNLDNATAALTQFTVSSNTFTTASTSSKTLTYVIEIDSTQLDTANGFDCFNVTCGNAVNATVSVVGYFGGAGLSRYGGNVATMADPTSN